MIRFLISLNRHNLYISLVDNTTTNNSLFLYCACSLYLSSNSMLSYFVFMTSVCLLFITSVRLLFGTFAVLRSVLS